MGFKLHRLGQWADNIVEQAKGEFVGDLEDYFGSLDSISEGGREELRKYAAELQDSVWTSLFGIALEEIIDDLPEYEGDDGDNDNEEQDSASQVSTSQASSPYTPPTQLPSVQYDTRTVNEVSFDLVYCPAGRSKLGEENIEFEIPKAFWMGQTQVTQELWKAVMGNNPSVFEGTHLPVEKISWFDCVRFCNKLSELEGLQPAYSIGDGNKPNVEWNKDASGYRLPSEHEWEMAARAGTDFEYAGSNNLDEVGWYYDNAGGQTRPVAQKKPNGWGLYDMSGNVFEWCNNPYYDVTADPYAYQSAPVVRSVRGGDWDNDAVGCRVAIRSVVDPDECWGPLGLRLIRPMNVG